jgi:hypothetical protein
MNYRTGDPWQPITSVIGHDRSLWAVRWISFPSTPLPSGLPLDISWSFFPPQPCAVHFPVVSLLHFVARTDAFSLERTYLLADFYVLPATVRILHGPPWPPEDHQLNISSNHHLLVSINISFE